jgi:hypothetical protein
MNALSAFFRGFSRTSTAVLNQSYIEELSRRVLETVERLQAEAGQMKKSIV